MALLKTSVPLEIITLSPTVSPEIETSKDSSRYLVPTILIPAIVITMLSAASAILTGISARFNFQNKKMEINNLIAKLNKIQSKLDYVISCNGNLTQAEYNEILKDF